MSAYRDALQIDSTSSRERIRLAFQLLQNGAGAVLLEGRLALRSMENEVLCDVIAHKPRSAEGYRAIVTEARAALMNSFLWSAVEGKRLRWSVVEDYGTGTIALWEEK